VPSIEDDSRLATSWPEVGKARLTFHQRRTCGCGPDCQLGPSEDTIWIEVRLDQGWVAAHRIAPQDGRLIVGEVRLIPFEPTADPGEYRESAVPPGGARSDLVRSISAGEALSAAVEMIDRLESEPAPNAPWSIRDALRDFNVEPEQIIARRPHAATDAQLAEAAAAYADAYRDGARAYLQVAAHRLGLSPDTVSKRRRAAQDRGILTGGGHQGKGGGELTEYGRALVAGSQHADAA